MGNLKKILAALIFTLCMVLCLPALLPQSDISSVTAQAATLSSKKITLIKGTKKTLKLKGAKGKVKWSTNNKKVAIVSSKGAVTAKGAGTATITAINKNIKYTCTVVVESPKLSATKLTVQVGGKATLKLNGTTQKAKWSTSSKKVATVSSGGVITAKKAGTAKITAKVGSKKYTCKVTVKKAPEKVLSVSSQNLTINSTGNLTVTFKKAGDVIYNVSNPEIVSCEWSGEWSGKKTTLKIYGEKIGTTSITISNSYNSEKYVITVKVNKVATMTSKELAMAAFGINQAYYAAKFPHTLRINRIEYERNIVTGYGDTINRMVIRCSAMNGFGGYNYFYVVVIACNSNVHYSGAQLYNGYYIHTSSHSSNPGMGGYVMDNKTAVNAYHNIILDSKEIAYD